MHKLNGHDVVSLARFIRASELRSELKKIVASINADSDKNDVGMDGLLAIFECCGEKGAEGPLWDFIGGILDKPASEAEALELSELTSLLQQMKEENKDNLKSFFTALSSLLGRN